MKALTKKKMPPQSASHDRHELLTHVTMRFENRRNREIRAVLRGNRSQDKESKEKQDARPSSPISTACLKRCHVILYQLIVTFLALSGLRFYYMEYSSYLVRYPAEQTLNQNAHGEGAKSSHKSSSSKNESGTAVKPWAVRKDTSWCLPAKSPNVTAGPEGLLYVKIHKSASSTSAGVAYRIANNVGKRLKYRRCKVHAHHGSAQNRKLSTREADKGKSFLWSIVRHPTSRSQSSFFFFKVSRRHVEPTDENFLNYVEHNLGIPHHSGGYAMMYLRTQRYGGISKIDETNAKQFAQLIIDDYDFLGVAERYDESLVAMKLILGIPTGDIVHLSSKVAGGYDSAKCEKTTPPFMSDVMREYYDSEQWTRNVSVGDFALYEALNEKLDATIASFGKKKFRRAMNEYRKLKQQAEEICSSQAIFPCMNGTMNMKEAKTNCYWGDNGCGYPCIDQMILDKEVKR